MKEQERALNNIIVGLESLRSKALKRRSEIREEIQSLDEMIYRLKRIELSLSFGQTKTKVEIKGLKQLFCCLPDFEERVLEVIGDAFRNAL